jgi:hypothetical protein
MYNQAVPPPCVSRLPSEQASNQTWKQASSDESLATVDRVFYRGTSKRDARIPLREGLRDFLRTAEMPRLKYMSKQGIARWMHGGFYGRGTCVACNRRKALYFGTANLIHKVPPEK